MGELDDHVGDERPRRVLVAEDLFRPRFKITRLEALRARLLRNYWAIYLVLIISWFGKLMIHPAEARTWQEVRSRLEIGVLPWWVPVSGVGLFVAGIAVLLIVTHGARGEELDHWSRTP